MEEIRVILKGAIVSEAKRHFAHVFGLLEAPEAPAGRARKMRRVKAAPKPKRRKAKANGTNGRPHGNTGTRARLCPVPGCGKIGRGPRYQFLCSGHEDFPKAKARKLLDQLKDELAPARGGAKAAAPAAQA